MPSSSEGEKGVWEMQPVAALTAEYLEQRLGQTEQRISHLEVLLIERFERRLAETRADLLKWSCLFWIGQVAAIAGMLAFVLRSLSH
jgi:hypothetical protein